MFRPDQVLFMHSPLNFTRLPELTESLGVCIAILRLTENTQSERVVALHCLVGCPVRLGENVVIGSLCWSERKVILENCAVVEVCVRKTCYSCSICHIKIIYKLLIFAV